MRKGYEMLFNCNIVIYNLGVHVFSLCVIILYYVNFYGNKIIFAEEERSHDYIVVGAGSAGVMVAIQLARKGDTVLLLEAGPHMSSSLLNIPVLGPLLQFSYLDWQYETEPQEDACHGLKNRVSRWPMGRAVGGSNRLNNQIYLEGHYEDYNQWIELGNSGWSHEEVLYYFKKMVQHENLSNKKSRSSEVPLIPVNRVHYLTPLGKAVLAAAKELNVTEDCYKVLEHKGFMIAEVNNVQGSRWSPDQFLDTHKNIKLLSYSTVEKVLLRDKFEAYGVKYRSYGAEYEVHSHKGVILTAGTIGTPKILMLSGIGPKQLLETLNIPVLKNLPVGEGLLDHVTTGLDLIILNQSLPLNPSALISPWALWEYLYAGQGPLSFPGCEVIGLLNINASTDVKAAPEIQIMVLPSGISSDGGAHLRKIIGISDKLWNEYFSTLFGQQVVSLVPTLLHPKSVGHLHLRSADPDDQPVINPNYLTHPDDVETLIEGIQIIKKLINTAPLQKLGAKLNVKPLPGCEEHTFDTHSYWECYVRHLTLTAYHPIGTCRMGGSADGRSVVNPELRVHGTNALYVMDASVMPSLPSANINAAVMMIAQKGSDLVIQHWKHLNESSKLLDYYYFIMTRRREYTFVDYVYSTVFKNKILLELFQLFLFNLLVMKQKQAALMNIMVIMESNSVFFLIKSSL